MRRMEDKANSGGRDSFVATLPAMTWVGEGLIVQNKANFPGGLGGEPLCTKTTIEAGLREAGYAKQPRSWRRQGIWADDK
jgi:hypothetical protein